MHPFDNRKRKHDTNLDNLVPSRGNDDGVGDVGAETDA